MSVYTQTIGSGLVMTIPLEVTGADLFIGNVLIAIALVGLALIVVEVFF